MTSASFISTETPKALPAVAKALFKACERIHTGSVTVISPDGTRRRFGVGEPEAEFQVNDWGAVTAMAARGDVGLGESYAQGLWDSPDIEAVIKLGLLNEDVFDSHSHGTALQRFGFVLIDRFLRRNSKAGSSRNIRSHYDVGNEFYSLWLDPSMTYSSALYTESDDLEGAQGRKYDRLLDLTEAAPGARTLEIGCGWGGFAERAADRGRDVTAVTVSPSQRAYADHRLQGRADIRLQDYRDITGRFDAIASIEMIEAVGERYWPVYFNTLKDRLAEGGRAAIQAITVSDDLFPDYRRRSDYIRHYVFPGGMLLSPGRIEAEARRAGLEPSEPFFFGDSYARTLREWLTAFDGAADKIAALGHDAAFRRSWRFYLQICAAAFAIERTEVVHYAFRHAGETDHA